jgi:Ras GTPase-activating-like protein IQGAP2/3
MDPRAFAYQTRLLERTGPQQPRPRWTPSHRTAASLDAVRGKWEERARDAAPHPRHPRPHRRLPALPKLDRRLRREPRLCFPNCPPHSLARTHPGIPTHPAPLASLKHPRRLRLCRRPSGVRLSSDPLVPLAHPQCLCARSASPAYLPLRHPTASP